MNKIFSTSLLGLIAIFIASFGDEVASVTFAFAKVDAKSMGGVSILMSCALMGGLLAGPVSINLLNNFAPRRILLFLFIFAGITVMASASYYTKEYWVYMTAFILGCLGSVFWSVLAVLVPDNFEESDLLDINKVVHSIRNSGYILGPVLAGLLSSNFSVRTSLMIVGMIFLFASPFTRIVFRKKENKTRTATDTPMPVKKRKNVIAFPAIRSFFELRGMKVTFLPLMIAICATSTFNVAFVHLLLVNLHYSEAVYGYLISALSLGLVIGPVTLASVAQKGGDAFGACLCAVIIGFCLVLVCIYQGLVWLFFVLLLLGLANGVQNTLMSTFVMKVVPKERRNEWMPTYIFVLQLSVLAGFLLAGQVPTRHSQILIKIAGSIAVIAGFIGAIGNLIVAKSAKCRNEPFTASS